MKNIRIALAQINPVVGDLSGNTKKIISFVKRAEKKGVDIIAFPELAVCGYPPEDLLLKPHFLKKSREYINKIKVQCKNITAIVGFPDIQGGKIYNSAGILHKKKLIYTYHKIYLPNYGVFDEKRYFTAGREYTVINEDSIKWTVNICEDIWIRPGRVLHQVELRGSQLIINISASPYHMGKLNERKQLLEAQARRYHTYIAYCNMAGGQDELVFDGGSLIVSPEGRILIQAKQFEQDLIIADLTAGKQRKAIHSKKRMEYIKQIRLESNRSVKKTELPLRQTNTLSPLGEIYTALTLGLRDYVHKNGFKKVILGISGGIDSTLTALIAVDSIGKNNVTALSMPSPYGSKEAIRDKRILAKNLGIKLRTVPITEIFHKYLHILKPHFQDKLWDTTEENIQARIRGNILMAFSNKLGYLLLSTGNKSETSVGYCTLYGDMAGGFNALKDVPKGMVYNLTKYRNERANNKLVPKTIFTRAPSAELRKGQKDQDSLPPYPILDQIIKAYVEQNKSLAEIIKQGISAQTARKIIRLIDTNEYKRRQAPPGIKITPKAFGKDRRMPITCKAPI